MMGTLSFTCKVKRIIGDFSLNYLWCQTKIGKNYSTFSNLKQLRSEISVFKTGRIENNQDLITHTINFKFDVTVVLYIPDERRNVVTFTSCSVLAQTPDSVSLDMEEIFLTSQVMDS